MKNLMLVVVLLAVFFVGVLVGALGTAFYVRSLVQNMIEDGPREMRRIIMERLDSKIDFSEEQRKRVNEIIKEAQDKFHDFRSESTPEVGSIIGDADSMIQRVLKDEQKAKFKGLVDKLKKRWREGEEGLDVESQPGKDLEEGDISGTVELGLFPGV